MAAWWRPRSWRCRAGEPSGSGSRSLCQCLPPSELRLARECLAPNGESPGGEMLRALPCIVFLVLSWLAFLAVR